MGGKEEREKINFFTESVTPARGTLPLLLTDIVRSGRPLSLAHEIVALSCSPERTYSSMHEFIEFIMATAMRVKRI